jgi:hypothetical protein
MTKILAFAGLLAASQALAAGGIRVSSMNNDLVINQTLFKALMQSAGKVPGITLTGAKVTLKVNQDELTCADQACALSWDTVSSNYSRDMGAFNSALYTALNAWATSGGATDPAVHRVVYPQTGAVEIRVTQSYGSNDEIECSLLSGYSDCTMIVSDITDGTTPELASLYQTLETAPSLMQEQTQALLATVATARFATPGKPALIESVHTVYTDMIQDSYVVSGFYAYKTPVVVDGQIVSDGIELSLTGSLSSQTGQFATQIAQGQSYVLSRPPPR